jgi:hypothetical protein
VKDPRKQAPPSYKYGKKQLPDANELLYSILGLKNEFQ